MDTVFFEEVQSFDVEPVGFDEMTKLGGWSPFAVLKEEDKKVFDEAMEGFVGVKYEPEKVSKQIVNGTNYRFFCYGAPTTLGAHTFPAIVKIYAAPGGKAQNTAIERVVL